MINPNELIEIARKCGVEIYDLGKREAYLNQGRVAFDHNQLQAFAQEIRNRTIDECKNEAIAQYKTNSQYNGRYIAECIENLKEFNSAKELSDYLKSEVSK